MPARLRFLGAKRRAEAVGLAERRAGRFVVKLAGLRQIHFFVFEIIHFKQRRRALARGRRENRRIHQHEAVRIEIIADALDHLVPHCQRRMLAAAAQPQMAMVHQKIDAVILGRDRIRIGFRHALHDVGAFHIQFISAGRALLGADLAANDQRRFLRQILQFFKQLFGQRALHGDALDDAGAVAHLREADFSAAPQVVQPARRSPPIRRRAGRPPRRSRAGSELVQDSCSISNSPDARNIRCTAIERMLHRPAPLSIPAAADNVRERLEAAPWCAASQWCRLRRRSGNRCESSTPLLS